MSLAPKEVRTPQERVRFEMHVRMVGRWVLFWATAVRFPLIAFSLGAAMQVSPSLLLPSAVALIAVSMAPGLGLLFGLASLLAYFTISNVWFACFLAALWFVFFVESRANYLHTKKQAEFLLTDLLSPQSEFTFKEVEIPGHVYDGFPSYFAKDRAREFMERVASNLAMTPEEMIPFKASSLRAFRFQATSEKSSVGAAAAFPVHRYTSLVFLRHSFEDLNEAQRFQIYHEIAHGTPEGADVLLRPLRWSIANPMTNLFMVTIFVMSCVAGYRAPSLAVWASLLMLMLANRLRTQIDEHVQNLSLAASEVLADSIALSHPDFAADGKWRRRANNQAKRLEDELEDMSFDDPRHLQVRFRAGWLRRWLNLGEVPPYHVGDVDPRTLPAFALYASAGFFSNLPAGFAAAVFWTALILCGVLFQALIALNGFMGNAVLRSVEVALMSRVTLIKD